MHLEREIKKLLKKPNFKFKYVDLPYFVIFDENNMEQFFQVATYFFSNTNKFKNYLNDDGITQIFILRDMNGQITRPIPREIHNENEFIIRMYINQKNKRYKLKK